MIWVGEACTGFWLEQCSWVDQRFWVEQYS